MRATETLAALVGLAAIMSGSAAHAHGNLPSPATFTSPPRLSVQSVDGGERVFMPYAFPSADASFDVAWEDGDVDPISRHYFYYLDHAPPLALAVTDVEAQATAIPESAGGFWAACSCPGDFGMCPDAGTRDCRNAFTWDTHALAPGAYWLIAITRDPPYDVYTVSDGPVRVSHGGDAPPAVIVVRPDGFGTFDTTYRIRWMQTGVGTLHVDLAYESDDEVRAGAPWKPLATDVPLTTGSDGTFAFDWDLSALPSARIYHVRATIKDGSGQTTSSDSRAGVTVFHPGDDPDFASPSDLASGKPDDSGCTVAARGPTPAMFLGVLGAIAALALFLRRRA